MIHNDEDDAVPWYQGIEYYLALRRLGKEVYMFSYNGEKHGLRKRINQKEARHSTIVSQWNDNRTILRNHHTPGKRCGGIATHQNLQVFSYQNASYGQP